jgi:excisionase family DNA binding protein
MTKITSDHLARSAFVYVRQSTPQQVAHNLESQRRQYALAERGRQLGWGDVQVIDDDLGRTGDGRVTRPGFERLLAAICEERVGAVLSIEASRLARNGREWHTLLEFCGVVDTLIIDEDGIYDPRLPNDKLLLGMKGTMSEMELSILRQRAGEARQQKARRGELLGIVAVGYSKVDDGKIEKQPDRRVQEAITLVFQKFREMQSARQVFLWMEQDRILLPTVIYIAGKRSIEWKAPSYRTVYHILTNPVYSGAYAFGRRTKEIKIDDGHKRIVSNRMRHSKDWKVLIKNHHEGYISWEEFERNQRLLADNANRRSDMGRGSVRRGEALLAGLFRCARCGKKLQVSYSGDPPKQRYVCPGPDGDTFASKCIAFGGLRSDRAVAQEILDRLQPLGIEAAIAAIHDHDESESAKKRQLENALEQARFETARAHRQYDQVDPENRLVAGELERRWNEKLISVRALEDQLAQQDAERSTTTLTAGDRQRLLTLGADLQHAWDTAGTTAETRKKIIRLLIDEIIVDVVVDHLELIVHWHGGDHSRLHVKKNKPGQNSWVTSAEVVEMVRMLARRMRDAAIASVLNRSGKSTGRGNSWTSMRVASLRNYYKIVPYREGERAERGEVTVEEAADALAVSPSTILRMINDQVLPAQHLCKGAPWIISSDDLQRDDVRANAKARRPGRPPSDNPQQRNLTF